MYSFYVQIFQIIKLSFYSCHQRTSDTCYFFFRNCVCISNVQVEHLYEDPRCKYVVLKKQIFRTPAFSRDTANVCIQNARNVTLEAIEIFNENSFRDDDHVVYTTANTNWSSLCECCFVTLYWIDCELKNSNILWDMVDDQKRFQTYIFRSIVLLM